MRFQLQVNIFFAIFFNNCMYADDMITRGFIASQGSSTAVMTINSSGIQQLSGNFTGEIVISASNVTLDLRGFTVFGGMRGIRITGSNVMVQNGTVRGATVGMRIEGNNNYVQGLDFIANNIGLEIVSNANLIETCNAFNNSSAGFSLVGASRNKFNNCRAIDNGSTGNAYGFVAQNGSANIFEECIAEHTQTTGSTPLLAAGFLLTGTEQKSKVLNCQSNNASGAASFGMYVDALPSITYVVLDQNLNAVFTNAGTLQVAWLQAGLSYYVALTDASAVRILQFNPCNQMLRSLPNAVFSSNNTAAGISWQQAGNSYYLACGNTNTLSVLSFNPTAETLTLVSSQGYAVSASLTSVAWQSTYLGYYLLSTWVPGVSNTYDQNVVSFNAISQALGTFAAATRTGFNQVMNKSATVSLLTTGTVYFEAVAGTGVGAGNNILFNERNPSTLARLGTTFFAFGEDVNTISWQNINQNAYLAVGGPTLLKIYLLNPSAVTLSQVLSTNAFGAVNSISWQNIGGTYYLALGGTSSMNVVSFNSTASTVTSVATYPGSTQSVSGGASSYFINLVLAQGSTVRVLAVDRYSSAGNFFLNNISQGNMTGYYEGCSPSSPNQWLGNLGVGNATNFSIASQFPISAATGTGVGTAENIDASLITGGPAEKIMRTVVDQAAPTIAQVSTFIQCQPTYISGATTLSGNSYYALGRAVDGQITLNGVSNVSLNLMGRRVRNILVQNCSRITILNGYISGGGVASALDVDGSTNIHLQNLVVTGATYGLRVQNNTTNITAENCLFNSNATAGVQIESGRGNSFMYCTANKNGTNGFVFTGTGHTATYCFANRNTVGAGFKILANSIANEVRSCSACVNATGYDYAITTSNIAISNFASGNTSANYVTNIRWGVTTATSGGSANYTSNVQI